MNFSQTLELMDENGVTAYKMLEDSKRPANYGGPYTFISWIVLSLAVLAKVI